MNEIKFSHRMGIEDSTAINDGSEEKKMKKTNKEWLTVKPKKSRWSDDSRPDVFLLPD